MLATSTVTSELHSVFKDVLDLERLATAQQWWMYGRLLPEAGSLAEIASLLAAARVDLEQLLAVLGRPPVAHMTHPGTSELFFAQSFAGDQGWASAHREEAISVLQLTAQAVPLILMSLARVRSTLGANAIAAATRSQLERIGSRLDEVRTLVVGY